MKKLLLGYSKQAGENAEYWTDQLPNYQKAIDAAKALITEVIEELAMKGVNVNEIEKQTKATEAKIAELDKKLEDLPDIKTHLFVQYKKEKVEKMKISKEIDFIKERGTENKVLFYYSTEPNSVKINYSNTTQLQNDENVQAETKRKR
ncbi:MULTISPECIES: hypothetical protein [Chryseobacterium]|uniref:hypothetical protein n=1 Tax=Chryseobacterium TaxID=59732 RepID=UPI0004E6FE68|nr:MULTISPECIES: hypothetical protein [Chryseobacterium]KFF73820.1 hypothetical protein HX13_17605 [Chryseobacterium sp. P1-3]